MSAPARLSDEETGNLDGLDVYDGRIPLGTTFDLGCRYAAQLVDGTDLGTFANRSAAVSAIIASAKVRA